MAGQSEKENAAATDDPDYCGPEGNRLRKKADDFGDERSRLHKAADAAFDSGDKGQGHALMAEAKLAGEQMHATHAEAAKEILRHRNEGKGDRYLDLHGLRVEEAMSATKEKLDTLLAMQGNKAIDLELIPGAGHHSKGEPLIKIAVEKELKERKLQYEAKNAGTFIVSILEGSDASAVVSSPDEEALSAVSDTVDNDVKVDMKSKAESSTPQEEEAALPISQQPIQEPPPSPGATAMSSDTEQTHVSTPPSPDATQDTTVIHLDVETCQCDDESSKVKEGEKKRRKCCIIA